MLDEIEDDDEQFFAEELRAKQHKEQMGVLKGIATSLNKPQDNGVEMLLRKVYGQQQG